MSRLARAFAGWSGVHTAEAEGRLRESGGDSLETLLYGFRPEESFSSDEALSTPVDGAFGAVAKILGVTPLPFWPEGKPYAFCTTHDIDRILSSYHGLRGLASRPSRVPGRLLGDMRSLLSRDTWKENPFFNFERSNAIEGELGVRSAYYVLFERRRIAKSLIAGEVQHVVGVYRPEDVREELRELEAAGHEIGVHASFDAWGGDEGATRSLGSERDRLLALGIKSVSGVRNHYLEYDARQTARSQKKAGLAYDSTYGFNSKCGFRSGTSFPYEIDGIWELPFQVMDSALRVSGGSAEDRRQIAHRALDRVRKSGGVFVLNWHFHTMNPAIFPEEIELYRELVGTAKRDGAWTALPREVISWWSERGTR